MSVLITPEMVRGWRPCPDYPDERVRELLGDGLTWEQVAALDIPKQDRCWALLHEEILPERDLRLLACRFAYGVLPLFEARFPGDERPRAAIRVARRYALGLSSSDELRAAHDAAQDAGCAAGYAAWAAAAGYSDGYAAQAAAGYAAAGYASAGADVGAAARCYAAWRDIFADIVAVLRGELDLEAEAREALAREEVH